METNQSEFANVLNPIFGDRLLFSLYTSPEFPILVANLPQNPSAFKLASDTGYSVGDIRIHHPYFVADFDFHPILFLAN